MDRLGHEDLEGKDVKLMRECFDSDPEYGSIFYLICDEIASNEVNAQLWFEASKHADRFDGKLNLLTDSLDLQTITGGSSDPEVWPQSTARFMSRQGNNYHVSTTTIKGSFNLARNGEKESLFNLARYARKMLFAKRLQLAAQDVMEERGRRLRAKLGLHALAPILPAHRIAYPHFNHMTLALMAAYMDGSRDERIFAIEDMDMEHVDGKRIQYGSWAKGVKPIEE